ncbi:Histone deacetylase-like amidohydrolase [Burkholderiales bacterium]|nr:Histone deacetylase-like amidohydrolase [Burkholderiales bacterium]
MSSSVKALRPPKPKPRVCYLVPIDNASNSTHQVQPVSLTMKLPHSMAAPRPTALWVGDALTAHRLPGNHPNSIDRQTAFLDEAQRAGLLDQVRLGTPRLATREELRRFHDAAHVSWVELCSRKGSGHVDDEDTPAYPGVFEAAATRVGTALDALEHLMGGQASRSFQPVGGMHHGRRHRGAGFCPFNDIGVVIETLRTRHQLRRVAYIDIDAHQGDGVYDSYARDPDLIIADIHQDGRTLYPGTGHADETGIGAAAGTKLNLPLAPGATDHDFFSAWARAQVHLERFQPEFFIFQCGADSLAGDPLADLRLSSASHAHATRGLLALAERYAKGRLMVFGGGGYHAANVASAWTAVLRELTSNAPHLGLPGPIKYATNDS